jgi:hypothetical protein
MFGMKKFKQDSPEAIPFEGLFVSAGNGRGQSPTPVEHPVWGRILFQRKI